MLYWSLPWTLLIWVWNLVDFAISWLFYGIFIWCKPIAYVFIWIINIAQLPINMFGWIYEFMWGIHKFPIDGWLTFVGDGCFLRWGRNCWYDKRLPFRTNMDYMNLSFLFKADNQLNMSEPAKPTYSD